MKIGIDGRLWKETGVGRYIRALVSHLSLIDRKNTYYLFLKKEAYGQVTVPNRWYKVLADVPWHSWSEQLVLPFVFRRVPIDLLHLPYFSVPLMIAQPFVVTIHDITISQFATGKATTKSRPIYSLKRIGYEVVLKSAIARSCKILTVSETVRNQLLQEYSVAAGKIVVTYEAGELETGADIKAEMITSPYLLYVGNAHPHKNLELLVVAFKKILRKMPKLKLVLVGRKDYFYRRVERVVATCDLGQNVMFVGEVSNGELRQWYKKAALFIFPSLAEGFGIPGLEAMNLECPVLASDIPVFREIYADAAVYFNPRSVDSLVEKAIAVLSDTRLQLKLRKLGLVRVKNYSWEKMAVETLRVYESCVRI